MIKILLVFILTLILLFTGTIGGRTFLDGKRQVGDKILYQEYIQAAGSPLHRVNRQVAFDGLKGRKVTMINVTDLALPTSEKGGRVSLLSGGAGYTFAILDFRSEISKGLNFEVVIYGK
ncbi:uncharacterized protein LOC123300567 [Chrysoperla carnea]|uniref:uncharacterized protein LOC123300567 n=1 Tax=Chrysoperla carnea TaxID=189513 RepID=UPI001D06409B|nr:uncharacterized protein LOC123300567 [Chrysoperla carnea]